MHSGRKLIFWIGGIVDEFIKESILGKVYD
jgi:hypothetical protein